MFSPNWKLSTNHGNLGCKSIGFDVSPLCIGMARDVAKEEGLSEEQCSFHTVDATVDPDEFLAGKCCFISSEVPCSNYLTGVHLTD
jgi:hypothetical protein